MGGLRSGNAHWWQSCKKTTVEDCLSLDANRWMREGILKANVALGGWCDWLYRSGSSFRVNFAVHALDMASPRVRLYYSWTWSGQSQPQSADYHVDLTTTQPYLGGLRWWFVCPLIVNGRPCQRRVGKLYLPPRHRYFGCRQCYDLTYTSCQESSKCDSKFFTMLMDPNTDIATLMRALRGQGRRKNGDGRHA